MVYGAQTVGSGYNYVRGQVGRAYGWTKSQLPEREKLPNLKKVTDFGMCVASGVNYYFGRLEMTALGVAGATIVLAPRANRTPVQEKTIRVALCALLTKPAVYLAKLAYAGIRCVGNSMSRSSITARLEKAVSSLEAKTGDDAVKHIKKGVVERLFWGDYLVASVDADDKGFVGVVHQGEKKPYCNFEVSKEVALALIAAQQDKAIAQFTKLQKLCNNSKITDAQFRKAFAHLVCIFEGMGMIIKPVPLEDNKYEIQVQNYQDNAVQARISVGPEAYNMANNVNREGFTALGYKWQRDQGMAFESVLLTRNQ